MLLLFLEANHSFIKTSAIIFGVFIFPDFPHLFPVETMIYKRHKRRKCFEEDEYKKEIWEIENLKKNINKFDL